MFRKVLLLFFFIFNLLSLRAQNTEGTIYSELEDALANASKVTEYYLDCNVEDDSVFFTSIKQFPNLKKITIVGFQKNNFPPVFFTSKQIENITLVECLGLKYPVLFSELKDFQNLTTLTFDESDINQIPPEIISINKLSALTLTDCENLNLEKSIPNLAQLTKLRYLALPVNQLSSLPINIGMLKQVEVLDISNNYLYDLPDETANMQNLKRLSTQGNIFIKPIQSFEKIKALNIKYLAAGKSLSEDERIILQNLFPNSVIEFKDSDDMAPNDLTTNDTTAAGDIKYGKFQINKQTIRILSDAYIHYPNLFNNALFRSPFDSLLFDERYADTVYSNINKVTTSNNVRLGLTAYNIFQLELLKKPQKMGLDKKSILFSFKYGNTQFRSYNPEMRAFWGMAWVYKGPLNLNAFKRKFIKNKKNLQYWCDIRVDYNNADNIFNVELKNRSGFEKFPTYVVSINQGIDKTLPLYGKQYLRYTKALESRKIRFNKTLSKRKSDYIKTKHLAEKERWDSFAMNYFCSEEKKLSREQWFEYYDYIVGHEEELLNQSEITPERFMRMLTLKNYLSCNAFGQMFLFDSAAVSQKVLFTDQQDYLLPVKQIYVLNTKNKIFYTTGGSLGVDPNTLQLHQSNTVAIVVILRNDDIGVLTPEEYATKGFPSENNVRVRVHTYSKKLATIKQILEVAGL
ncbi:MAG: leucine-rich repeat domain-containing protein [Bacteroidota bacterium]